jgi:hypothetical protein
VNVIDNVNPIIEIKVRVGCGLVVDGENSQNKETAQKEDGP